ncbi:helix-turn-helix domain-containing protein [bacterium]|nr:helix-turn-helix domain-containing protein [bacterium]
MKKDQISIKFGEKVRKVRIKKGLSQEKLAELADLHRNYIGMIERAERNVTLMNAAKIAKALKLRVRDLIDK